MKIVIAAVALVLSAPAIAAPCKGYYAYIPKDRDAEVAFSIQIQPTAVKVLYADFGNDFAEKRTQADGSLHFTFENSTRSTMRCDAKGATVIIGDRRDVVMGELMETPRKTYRLQAVKTDIFGVAKARGWELGD